MEEKATSRYNPNNTHQLTKWGNKNSSHTADPLFKIKKHDFEGDSKKLLLVCSPEWHKPLSYALAVTERLIPFKEETVEGLEFTMIKEEGNTTRDKPNI